MKPFVDFTIPVIIVVAILLVGATIFAVGSGFFPEYHSWFLSMIGGTCCIMGVILFHQFYLR